MLFGIHFWDFCVPGTLQKFCLIFIWTCKEIAIVAPIHRVEKW
jgi:hypothetical protein